MTWKDFKEYVDSQIESDDVEIDFIDISQVTLFMLKDKPVVVVDPEDNILRVG